MIPADWNKLPEHADSDGSPHLEAVASVLEKSRFKLNDAQWMSFIAALDAPPKELPRLRKLLQQPSVFDGD